MGDLSLNFSRSEFVCSHCGRRVGPVVALVDVLQRLRTEIGAPLVIVSGYRCVEHNRKVGGTRTSEHLRGRAADFRRGLVRPEQARAAGARGIGTRAGWVIHVDMRTTAVRIFEE
jgi:uncharacterized protein YcbK (DUF882 family)